MQKLIKDGLITDDKWTVLKEATGPEVLRVVSGKNFLVPLQFWKLYRSELDDYAGEIAVWLDSDQLASDLGKELHSLPVIALNFPVFSDGRSYSNARELREHFDYKGELRAIGDVLRDQIYYMASCGFDAFALRHDQDPDACLKAYEDFRTNYQATIKEPQPLFRRR